jgi:glycerol-3-phosphate dehydrogenase
MKRDAHLAALRAAPALDLLVIGGGITGAAIALEAARAGARVALVEAHDHASGTSSRSSKLVHGGLRYLAQGQFGLTRDALRERNALLADAPGLVQPLRFVLPVRTGDRHGRVALGLALACYDALAGRRTRAWLDKAALLGGVPTLAADGLRGGWSYLDAQTDDARLVLRVLAEACRLGALAVNHLAATGLERNAAGVAGASLHDAVTGERLSVRAAAVINATGVWADGLRGMLGRPPRLRPLRGSHLLLPAARLPLSQAVAFFHPGDGRFVFALPWEGTTLVGTTDLDHRDDLAIEPGITAAELDYLLRALRHQFPALALTPADVLSTWSGVRPVLASGRAVDPSQETREHLVIEEDGLITVTGGKLTTFRSTAIEALQLAARRVPALRGLQPGVPLLAPAPAASAEALHALTPELRARWLARYGAAAAAVRACALPDELEGVGGMHTRWAELRWACRSEAVVHLDDLLLRRTRLGLLLPRGGAEIWPRLRGIVTQELGWSVEQWDAESARYHDLIARCYSVPVAQTP